MGSTFLSRKEAAVSQPLRGPRAHELPGWSRHRAGRGGAGWAASGQPLTRLGTAGAVKRGRRTQLSRAPAHRGLLERKPTAAQDLGLLSPERCRASRTWAWVLLPQRKGALSIQAHPTETLITRRPSPGTLGHPYGRPPVNDLATEGSEEDWGERDWSGEVGTPVCRNWGGLGKCSKSDKRKRRVGASVPATCRTAADRELGVGDSGPLGGPPPESHPAALSARRGAGRNLGSQRHRCGSRSVASPPAPPPARPRAYLGQPQPPPPRSRAPAKGATGAPLQRLLLRRPLSPCCLPRSGVRILFRAPGARERHGEPGAEASGSRGSSASDCSTAAPYSSRAGRSEPPRAGHPEDARVPIASHGGATAAATVTARVARRPCCTARSRRCSRRRVSD